MVSKLINILFSIALVLLSACSGPNSGGASVGGSHRGIRNGNSSSIGDVVMLRTSETVGGNFNNVCSSTFIAPRLLLTAGHCVQDVLDDYRKIQVIDSNGDTVGVSSISIHPGYDFVENINSPDVALVQLSNQTYRFNFRTLHSEPLPVDANFTAVGFGQDGSTGGNKGVGTQRSGLFTFKLSKVATSPEGQEFLDGLLEFEPASTDQIACPGDSGGPVLFSDGSIAGVASYVSYVGPLECSNVKSATYGSMRVYSDWIESEQRRLSPQSDCVQDGQFISTDGGCKNSLTGRVWSAQIQSTGRTLFNYSEAAQMCSDLTTAEQRDWVLPSEAQIKEMIQFGGVQFLKFMTGGQNGTYWTSTESGQENVLVNIQSGDEMSGALDTIHKVLCVRG